MEPKANGAEVAAVLPEEIQKKLRALVRRVKRVILLRGLLAVSAVLLLSVLGVMAIDASFTIFSGWVRWVLSLSALALTVWAAVRFLIKPLRRKISLAAVARAVEARHPEMEERVSTAVELLAGESKFDRGSEQLLKKVVEFAVKDVGDVTPEAEFTTKSARKFKWVALAALGVLVVAFVVWPKQAGLLFARALAPFAEIGNAYSGKIQSITGDLTVAKGEPVTLEVVIENPGVRRADLRTVIAGAEVEAVERMEREGDSGDGTRRFVFRIPAVAESFDYRVHCGKILSSAHTVEALDRPAVAKLEISYRYPEYTGLGIDTLPEEAREILAPVGTEVVMRAGLNREVEQVVLTVDGEELPTAEMGEDSGQPVPGGVARESAAARPDEGGRGCGIVGFSEPDD
ncbi:MAG: hypothetical protein P8J87_12545, partial [Verrucomicrobiales bacterium]|nr:hypothetical protein [Verrucomicrobiales bacterium]